MLSSTVRSLFVIPVFLTLLGCPGCGAPRSSTRPVALVNGEPITEQQLTDALRKRAGAVVLRQMIDEQLIRQAAKKAGLTASPEEVDVKINDLRARYPSAKDFEQMVANSGQTMARLRQNYELQVLFEKLAKKEVHVSPEQCRDYYEKNKQRYRDKEQVRLRDMEFESKENARNVLKALKAGGDFAALAKEFSTDPATKDKGGDMGLLPVDSLQPHFRKAVAKLKPGEISGVFQGMGAWYLVKLEKRVPERQRSFAECKDEIRKLLERQQQQLVQAGLIQRLRQRARIEVKDPELALPGLERKEPAPSSPKAKTKGK